jgi:hypothetical protein
MILFDKGIWLKQEENVHLSERVVIQYRERDVQQERMSRYILSEVETSHHLISIRLYFILTI